MESGYYIDRELVPGKLGRFLFNVRKLGIPIVVSVSKLKGRYKNFGRPRDIFLLEIISYTVTNNNRIGFLREFEGPEAFAIGDPLGVDDHNVADFRGMQGLRVGYSPLVAFEITRDGSLSIYDSKLIASWKAIK